MSETDDDLIRRFYDEPDDAEATPGPEAEPEEGPPMWDETEIAAELLAEDSAPEPELTPPAPDHASPSNAHSAESDDDWAPDDSDFLTEDNNGSPQHEPEPADVDLETEEPGFAQGAPTGYEDEPSAPASKLDAITAAAGGAFAAIKQRLANKGGGSGGGDDAPPPPAPPHGHDGGDSGKPKKKRWGTIALAVLGGFVVLSVMLGGDDDEASRPERVSTPASQDDSSRELRLSEPDPLESDSFGGDPFGDSNDSSAIDTSPSSADKAGDADGGAIDAQDADTESADPDEESDASAGEALREPDLLDQSVSIGFYDDEEQESDNDNDSAQPAASETPSNDTDDVATAAAEGEDTGADANADSAAEGQAAIDDATEEDEPASDSASTETAKSNSDSSREQDRDSEKDRYTESATETGRAPPSREYIEKSVASDNPEKYPPKAQMGRPKDYGQHERRAPRSASQSRGQSAAGRPAVRFLAVTQPMSCSTCRPAAVLERSGVTDVVSHGGQWRGYTVRLAGDRLSLSQGNAEWTYLPER